MASQSKKAEPIYNPNEMLDKVLIQEGRSGNHHILESASKIEVATHTSTTGWREVPIQKVIRLTDYGFLVHPEHKTITLPPGVYAFTQQQEYNPILDEMQYVFD